MRNISAFLIFTSIAFVSNTLSSQKSDYSLFDIEPVLHNGRQYLPNLIFGTQGHPFIYSPDYVSGYVIIRSELFNNVLLNYDIYNQELVLKYRNFQGNDSYIMISKAWLNKFNLQDNDYELMETGDGKKEFFQVIGPGSLKVLYHWKKQLELSMQTGNKSYSFSEPVKTMYLSRDGGFYKFRNNKSFLAFFDSEREAIIKRYLSQNRINVKNASDEIMLDLITYCCLQEN